MIDARHKEEMRDTQFPKDLERAYELEKRLVNTAVCGNIIEIEVMLSRQPDFLVVEIVDHDGMAIL